ncbi:hypothetical protein M5689_024725 [Euphorbia peplus]|nr:hypothetical protein M5689_024725 [Euphorbia peplus]
MRGRIVGQLARGRGVQDLGRFVEDDREGDELSDCDDEDFQVDLNNIEEDDEESEDDIPNSHDDNFEDNVESDGSDLSEVSNNEKDVYSLDESNEDNAFRSRRKEKYKDRFKGMYDNPFVDPGVGNIKFEVGRVYDDVESFRKVLRDYAVHGGHRLKRVKNDKVRVRAKCIADNCTWRIHVACLQDNITFMVKKLQDHHTCTRPEGNKNPNARTKF